VSAPPSRLHELPRPWLQALLASAGGICPAPPHLQIDWAGVATDAASHAIGVLVWNRLRDLNATSLLPASVQLAWEADNRHARLQTILQERDAREISAALIGAGVRHAFLKGATYRSWLYDPPWGRAGADLDLLIDRCDVERVRSTMLALGFHHASSTIDYRHFRPATAAQVGETESAHYELAQLVRTSRLTNVPDWLLGGAFVRRPPFTFEARDGHIDFHTVVDIHWTVHFTFAAERPLDTIVAAGRALPRLSTGWNLVTTAFKLYYEAFDRPYYGFHHLADLAAMLQTQPSAEDWRLVDGLVQRHGLWAPLFYTLAAAASLTSATGTPDELLAS